MYRGGLWLVLVAFAAAYENYDDLHPLDLDGDDDSYDLDPGEIKDLSLKDLMMIQIISSLQNSDHDEIVGFRPKFSLIGKHWPDRSSQMIFKDAVIKKSSPRQNVKDIKVKPVTRHQPRWRIKRPPGLCFLKLCAPIHYSYE